MDYPNKIYVLEYKNKNAMGGISHLVIVVEASSSNVAKEYIKKLIGIDVEPTWLMDAVCPTIWSSDGSTPKKVQAKILYNASYSHK